MKMFDRRTRLDSIDIFKFIGSFFVIAIHTNIFSSFSTGFNWMFVNIVARLAVYFYFVASAYLFFRGIEFCNGKITKSKEKRLLASKKSLRLKSKICKLTIIQSYLKKRQFLYSKKKSKLLKKISSKSLKNL